LAVPIHGLHVDEDQVDATLKTRVLLLGCNGDDPGNEPDRPNGQRLQGTRTPGHG
jgi:hypothetical protein